MTSDRSAFDNERDDDQLRHADDVRLILSGLGPTESDALRLVYFRGLTQAQTARALGLSPSTVSRCVAEGMRELSRQLLQTSP